MQMFEMTNETWVAEALRCYDNEDIPTVCWSNIFIALCEEVIALRKELDGTHVGSIEKRSAPQTEGSQS